jgi:hypothetical protein
MDDKRREKYLQNRYKRELERYLNRVVNFVMQGSFDREAYAKHIDNVTEKLEQCQKVALYNEYYEKLEEFIQMTQRLKESDLDGDEIQAEVMHTANLLRKMKRKKSYNRKQYRRIDEDEF